MTSHLGEASTREGIAALVVVDAVLVVQRLAEHGPLNLAPVVQSGLVLRAGWVKDWCLDERGVWRGVHKVGHHWVMLSLSTLDVIGFHYCFNGVVT